MAGRYRVIKGSVRQVGPDRWKATLPPTYGRRSMSWLTEDEAWDWLEEEQRKAPPARVPVTDLANLPSKPFGEVLLEYLAEAPLKKSTYAAYERPLRLFVLGTETAQLPIGSVLPRNLAKILRDSPANSTRLQLGRALSGFFEWADDNRYTPHGNPYRATRVRPIMAEIDVKGRDCLDEVWKRRHLLQFVEFECDPVYRDFWVFCAATGARRGEAIGLQWANVFLDRGWCWLETNVTVANGRIYTDPTTKSREKRKAFLSPLVVEMLTHRREEQEKFRAGARAWDGDWVFDRRTGWARSGAGCGVHLNPTSVTQRFKERSASLGLPSVTGPHMLRRMFATAARRAEVDESIYGRALGHHSSTVTGRHYNKVSERELRSLAALITKKLLGGLDLKLD